MAIPAEALDLIKSFEGYLRRLGDGTDRVKPYLCPANVPTVGWGSTVHPTGVRVKMTDPPIDGATATAYLAWELNKDENAFDRLTPRPIAPLARGAIISFIYNCGSGAYKASNLRKAVNDGRWSDVPAELRKWRMGGGRVLPGLVRRREAEGVMFLKGIRQGVPVAPQPPPQPDLPIPAPTAPAPKPPVLAPPRGFWRGWVDWLLK